jgi:putative membrane protein
MDWLIPYQYALPEHEHRELNHIISTLETKTQSEVVVTLVKAASKYQKVFWRQAVFMIFIVQLFTFSQISLHDASPFLLPLTLMVGIALAFLLWKIPAWKGLLIDQTEKAEKIQQLTERLFLHFNVTETKQRSGVLILVSLFEKRVHILADSGVYKLLPQSFWNELISKYQHEFKKGDYFAALKGIIGELGPELIATFPAENDNPNELPNIR